MCSVVGKLCLQSNLAPCPNEISTLHNVTLESLLIGLPELQLNLYSNVVEYKSTRKGDASVDHPMGHECRKRRKISDLRQKRTIIYFFLNLNLHKRSNKNSIVEWKILDEETRDDHKYMTIVTQKMRQNERTVQK